MKANNILSLFCLGAILILFSYTSHGQLTCVDPDPGDCGSVNQCAEIELNLEQGASCTTNVEYSARDIIRLKPGFHYKAETGRRFHAKIDNSIVLPVDYATAAPTAVGRSLDYSLPVGSIPGNADVTSTGGATYQVPIHIPPGTAGMQPQISLAYNSQSGNGIAGYGWNIAGLSVISRVQQTLFHNNQIIGVNLTNTDRFSLDGNLLIATLGTSGTIGTYGANGTVYHTELETFNHITSNGTSGAGPQWFEVLTKQGLIMEFGNSADSRFMDEAGTNVLFWRINKIRDLNGNYIEYIYNNDNRESRIVEIKYTGNTSLDPYNSIKFYYSEREDKNETWIAGHSVKSNLILRMIRVYAEGKLAKEYELMHFQKQYTTSIERPYSYLGEIIEYNGLQRTHFNSTIFSYGNDNVFPLNTTAKVSYPTIASDNILMAGDYNGNGISDLSVINRVTVFGKTFDTGFEVFLMPEGGNVFNASEDYSAGLSLNPYYRLYQIIDPQSDFNGNGKDEFAIAEFTYPDGIVLEKIELYEKNSSDNNFSLYKTINIPSGFNNTLATTYFNYFPGDFNGDGAGDFITVLADGSGNKEASIYFPNLSATKIVVSGMDVNAIADISTRKFVLDFDGDGKQELMLVTGNSTKIYSISQSGVATIIYSDGFPTSFMGLSSGDFNGDRKQDFMVEHPGGISVAFSTGTSFKLINVPFDPDFFSPKKIGDYNGDGKSDILNWFGNVFYSNGISFNTVENPINYDVSYDLIAGDFNGDGRTDEIHSKTIGDQINILYFNPDEKDLLLTETANGINQVTKFEYGSRSSASYRFGIAYRKRNNSGISLDENYQGSIAVVKKLWSNNSAGDLNYIDFSYGPEIIHHEGRGFLGFSEILSTNFHTNTIHHKKYQLNFIFSHVALTQEHVYSLNAGTLASQKLSGEIFTNFYHDYGDKRFFPHITESVTTKFFPPASSESQTETITETFTYDAGFVNGNLENHVIAYKGSGGTADAEITTENDFTTFGTWWIPSRLSKSTVTMHRPGGDPDYVRAIEYPSYNSAGQLLQQITDPAKAKKVITNFDYGNPFGNLKSTTVIADANQITNSVSFDPFGRFIITKTNAISQSSTAEYEPVYGNIVKKTSVDGLITTFNYDAFGQVVSTTSPDGNTSTVLRDWIQDFSPFSSTQAPVFFVQTNVPGAPETITAYNLLGQEIRKETNGLNGKLIIDKEYDVLSRVKQVFMPYYDGASSKPYTEFQYDDDYGYLKKEILSGTSLCSSCSTTYDINFKTLTTTNPAGQVSTRTTNSLGEITVASDPGGSITYSYDPSGLPKTITTNGSTVSMINDEYGRQTELTDPNAGNLKYEYDALGQLTKQTDARLNVYEMKYNLLGQIISSECTSCTTGVDAAPTTWQYINAGNGLNKVKRIIGPFSRTDFEYDNLGRTTKVSERIDGTAYETKYTYDQFSHISQITYPTANSTAPGFKIENTYNNDGYLTNVKNANTNAPIWELTKMNALGQPTEYNYGSNIICEKNFDELGLPDRFKAGTTVDPIAIQNLDFSWNHQTGNMNYRADDRSGFMISENFADISYDNLNRLLKSEVTGQTPVEINYYSNGNIQNKTNIGGYSYNGDKLNAVEQVGNSAGDISLMTQDIEYTPFNKVSKITEGIHRLEISYGPDQQRRKSILTNQATGLEERNIIYSGNYEKITADDGNTYEVNYLPGGAINVRKNSDASSDQMFYVFTDHLGSFNTITDANGNIVFEQNFDAWGRERNPDDWSYTENANTKPAWLLRGFTGHENLDEFALINMNGRVYDPLLGRMLSPDNFVQGVASTQSFNRYSYAINNPLKFTDPTGQETNTTGSWAMFDWGLLYSQSVMFSAEQSGWHNFNFAPAFLGGSGNNTFTGNTHLNNISQVDQNRSFAYLKPIYGKSYVQAGPYEFFKGYYIKGYETVPGDDPTRWAKADEFYKGMIDEATYSVTQNTVIKGDNYDKGDYVEMLSGGKRFFELKKPSVKAGQPIPGPWEVNLNKYEENIVGGQITIRIAAGPWEQQPTGPGTGWEYTIDKGALIGVPFRGFPSTPSFDR